MTHCLQQEEYSTTKDFHNPAIYIHIYEYIYKEHIYYPPWFMDNSDTFTLALTLQGYVKVYCCYIANDAIPVSN